MTDPEEELRTEARRRLTERRQFPTHLAAYVVVNAMFVVVWAMTGAGFFWPGFVLAGWGVGVLLHAWSIWFQRPVTPDEVEQEMRRMRHSA